MTALNQPLAILRNTWKDAGPMGSGSFRNHQFDEMFAAHWWWGIAQFWTDTTLGVWDCVTGSRVFPWRVLQLDQNMGPDPNDSTKLVSRRSLHEIVKSALDDPDDDFNIEEFSAIVVFMDPPPSDSKGSPSLNAAVVDRDGPMAHMAQEVGHALLMPHSAGPGGMDYGDPYCMMSGTGGTYTFSETTYPDPDVYHAYYQKMGPMTAAATLYGAIADFASCASVIRVGADARESYAPITLRAFSKATLGDPVLAVLEVEGETWTAEYRVPTGWDRGLPSSALVIHTIRPPLSGQMANTRYAGVVRIPFDRGIRDWEAAPPIDADLGVVVLRADDDTVTFRFRHKQAAAVSLDRELITLRSSRGPVSRQKYPVWNGLCGEREFDSHFVSKAQRLEVEAQPMAFRNPTFKWKVNGVAVQTGQSVTFSSGVDIHDELGVHVPLSSFITVRAVDDGAGGLPQNKLWLENDPKDGTYDVTVEVEVSEQGSPPPSSSSASLSDQFEGGTRIIDGKDEADRECRDYWQGLADRLPPGASGKRIDRGDPIWRALADRLVQVTDTERDEILGLVTLARALRTTDERAAQELAHALAQRFDVDERIISP